MIGYLQGKVTFIASDFCFIDCSWCRLFAYLSALAHVQN